MNFIQKIIIITTAIITCGTIYIGVKNQNKISDTVTIQSWKSFSNDSKKGLKIVGKAFTPPKQGKNGAMCTSNSECNSDNCASGICQNKFAIGGPCNTDGQCKSGRCIDGTCRIDKCAGIGMSCKHDTTCCSQRCIAGTCRRSHCKYGESSPGVCKLSPADTQTIIAASVVVAALAIIILTGGAAVPMVPIATTLVGGAGGIAGIQTNQELAKQNKERDAKNQKNKDKIAQTKAEAERVKLEAEKGLQAIRQAELEAEMEQLSINNKELAAEIEIEKNQLATEKNQLAEQIEKLSKTIETLQLRMNQFDAVAQKDRRFAQNYELNEENETFEYL